MPDVLLYQTPDGGEIAFQNGEPVMSDGLEQAAYLSLFGGAEEDSGSDGDAPLQWWGNLTETDPHRVYRSETQHLLSSIAATSANLRRIQDAATADLAWMTEAELATAIRVRVTIPKLNSVQIEVSIDVDGRTYPFKFVAGWGVTT